jgi:hypothetical protein
MVTVATSIGGCIFGCSCATCSAVGCAAAAAAQPLPALKPLLSQPTGSFRASMYSRKLVPAELPCRGGPGLRCASPENADHVSSVPTATTAPLEVWRLICSMAAGPPACMVWRPTATLLPLAAAMKRVMSRV